MIMTMMTASGGTEPSTVTIPRSSATEANNDHDHHDDKIDTSTTTNTTAVSSSSSSTFALPLPIISDPQQLLDYGICRVPIPFTAQEMQHWATRLSQVTPFNMAMEGDGEYAFYRNIMDEPLFPLELMLLDRNTSSALSHHFGIQNIHDELVLDDAFCVHYNTTQCDTTGAKHTDPSDITINMCLEKSIDAQGSHVLFHGIQPLVSSIRGGPPPPQQQQQPQRGPPPPAQFLVAQEPGFATIHWGHHPHETTALTQGRRTNIILTYCYTDPLKSDVSLRNCYG
jgi:hypothetical protein